MAVGQICPHKIMSFPAISEACDAISSAGKLDARDVGSLLLSCKSFATHGSSWARLDLRPFKSAVSRLRACAEKHASSVREVFLPQDLGDSFLASVPSLHGVVRLHCPGFRVEHKQAKKFTSVLSARFPKLKSISGIVFYTVDNLEVSPVLLQVVTGGDVKMTDIGAVFFIPEDATGWDRKSVMAWLDHDQVTSVTFATFFGDAPNQKEFFTHLASNYSGKFSQIGYADMGGDDLPESIRELCSAPNTKKVHIGLLDWRLDSGFGSLLHLHNGAELSIEFAHVARRNIASLTEFAASATALVGVTINITMSSDHARRVMSALGHSRSLKHVYVTGYVYQCPNSGDDTAAVYADFVRDRNLETMCFQRSAFTVAGAALIIAAAPASVRVIDLSNNNFGDEGAETLSKMDRHGASLILQKCGLSPECAARLALENVIVDTYLTDEVDDAGGQFFNEEGWTGVQELVGLIMADPLFVNGIQF